MECSPAACPKTPNHEDMPTHRSFPSLLSVVSTRVPTLQHIAKAIRNDWAGVVTDVLSHIDARPSDITAWTKFFLMAKCILPSPSQGGYRQWRHIFNTVRDRVRWWKAGNLTGLWTAWFLRILSCTNVGEGRLLWSPSMLTRYVELVNLWSRVVTGRPLGCYHLVVLPRPMKRSDRRC